MLVVVLVLNFIIPHLTPGSFVETYAEQVASQHHLPYYQVLARMEAVFGKPEPLPLAFAQYMRQILFNFPPNFGPSFQYYPLPAWALVLNALKWTMLLLGVSQIIAWGSSIFIGVYLALHKNRILDKVLQPNFYFINSIPSFFLAQVAIFIFALGYPWKILPVGGAYYIVPTVGGVLEYMLLPLAVIVVLSLPSHVLVIRSAAIDVIGSDFLQASKAQGLSDRRIIWRVMRNSLIPSLTQMFLTIGYLIGGILVIEVVFNYPGMGLLVENAILVKDYPVLQASLYVITAVVLIANLAADLMYPLVDPRVSYVSD